MLPGLGGLGGGGADHDGPGVGDVRGHHRAGPRGVTGPQGGDEVNIIRAATNYGWPVITYGVNYGIGTKIGEGTHKEGMAQPLYYWVPSIAPSGMTFYTGDLFPQWKGDLFIGAMAGQHLVRPALASGFPERLVVARELETTDADVGARLHVVA